MAAVAPWVFDEPFAIERVSVELGVMTVLDSYVVISKSKKAKALSGK